MKYETTFSVPWVHGLQRARNFGGRTVDTERNRADKMEVAAAYRSACTGARLPVIPCAPPGTPVSVHIRTRRPLPKSRPRAVESESDTKKPDCDNVIKLVLDGLNGVAYADDAQVDFVCLRKLPRIRDIEPITEVTVSWEVADE